MNSKKKNFWAKLPRPIKVLAPMAGYTDSAFRLLCKEFGADVVITELVSADAIAYAKLSVVSYQLSVKVTSNKHNSTADLLSFYKKERPIVVQLFGKHPEQFGLAAKWISENLKPDGIDINMGCPARKVVGSDHGAALLKNPDLAVEIVKAVKENTTLPVSVKTRLGWENDDEILEFAPKLVKAEIDAIIIHGRTYKDGFKGKARWDNIYKIKEMFGDELVVIGNGDITGISNSEFSASARVGREGLISNNSKNYQLSTKNCPLDGYAIGRAAFGKPWIFCEAENKYQVSSIPDASALARARRDRSVGIPTLSTIQSTCRRNKFQINSKSQNSNKQNDEKLFIKKTILRHAELVSESKGEYGIIEFRKHLLAYLRSFPEAKKLRIEAVKITSLSDIKNILDSS